MPGNVALGEDRVDDGKVIDDHVQELLGGKGPRADVNLRVIARLSHRKEVDTVRRLQGRLLTDGHVPLFVRIVVAILERQLSSISAEPSFKGPHLTSAEMAFWWDVFCEVLQAYHGIREQLDPVSSHEGTAHQGDDTSLRALRAFECLLLDWLSLLARLDRPRTFSLYFDVLERSALKPSKLRVWLLLAKGFCLLPDQAMAAVVMDDRDQWSFAERFLLRYGGKFKSVHGAELKQAVCAVLAWHGHQLNGHLQDLPAPRHLSSSIQEHIWPLLERMHGKSKYWPSTLPAMAAVVGLSTRDFFWTHLDDLLVNLTKLAVEESAPSHNGEGQLWISLNALLYVYLYRHCEAWATMGHKLERYLSETVLNRIHLSLDGQQVITVVTIVFTKLPRMTLQVVMKRLQVVTEDAASSSSAWDPAQISILLRLVENLMRFHATRRQPQYPQGDDQHYYCEDLEDLEWQASMLNDFEYAADARDFSPTLQRLLCKLLIHAVAHVWTPQQLDAREEHRPSADPVTQDQLQLLRQLLGFPHVVKLVPDVADMEHLADAVSKLHVLMEDYAHFGTSDTYLDTVWGHVRDYVPLWLAMMHGHLRCFLTPLFEALPRPLTAMTYARMIRWFMDRKPTGLEQLPDVLQLLVDKANCMMQYILKVDASAWRASLSRAFSERIFAMERLQRLYYFAISRGRSLTPECLQSLQAYFTLLLDSRHYDPSSASKGVGQRKRKSKHREGRRESMTVGAGILMSSPTFKDPATEGGMKKAWSLESLTSRLTLSSSSSTKASVGDLEEEDVLGSWLVPLLEHDNRQLRALALDVLQTTCQVQLHPHILQSLLDNGTMMQCSETLRDVRPAPRNLPYDDHADDLKVMLTTLLTHLLMHSQSVGDKDYQGRLRQVSQQHLMELFYHESEVDSEHANTALLSAFCRLVRALYGHHEQSSASFPRRLQVQLWLSLRKWQHDLHVADGVGGGVGRLLSSSKGPGSNRTNEDLLAALFMLTNDRLLSSTIMAEDDEREGKGGGEGDDDMAKQQVRPATVIGWLEAMQTGHSDQVRFCLQALLVPKPQSGHGCTAMWELIVNKCFEHHPLATSDKGTIFWQALHSTVSEQPQALPTKLGPSYLLLSLLHDFEYTDHHRGVDRN